MHDAPIPLRLDAGDQERLLALAGERSARTGGGNARSRQRFVFPGRTMGVLTEAGTGPVRRYEALALNLSATGVCVAVGSFVYPMRRYELRLTGLDGQARVVGARAEWCRHATKSAHLIGLRFDATLNPGDFIAQAGGADTALPDATERTTIAELATAIARDVLRGDADEEVEQAMEQLGGAWAAFKAPRAAATAEPASTPATAAAPEASASDTTPAASPAAAA